MNNFIRLTNNKEYDVTVNLEKVQFVSKGMESRIIGQHVINQPIIVIQFKKENCLSIKCATIEERDKVYEYMNTKMQEKDIPKFEYN